MAIDHRAGCCVRDGFSQSEPANHALGIFGDYLASLQLVDLAIGTKTQ